VHRDGLWISSGCAIERPGKARVVLAHPRVVEQADDGFAKSIVSGFHDVLAIAHSGAQQPEGTARND
jgi:hypothetical protein